jgi:P4 family phage/plasmid primase-like protien
MNKENKMGLMVTNSNRELVGHPDLLDLATKCICFNNDWQKQMQTGVDEETWFNWCSLLIKAGCIEAAGAFSRASKKHNSNSEERIEALNNSQPPGILRCVTFGCNHEQINQCFGGNHCANETGSIINSPATSLMPRKPNQPSAVDVGFTLNKEGLIDGINGNVFARYLLTVLPLVYMIGGRFFIYENGVYRYLDSNNLSRKCRDLVHSFAKDAWTTGMEKKYLSALTLETSRAEQMDADRNFINVENGMLDLRTFELVPHSREFNSTVRIPLIYDPTAECPRYMQFLSEVFEGDQERIDVSQEIIGDCLTGNNKAQKAIIALGGGSNGKSVWAEIIRCLCGQENVSAVPLKDLSNSFARFDLVGKILNLVTESETDNQGLNTEFFKAIVSGDPIRVERKFAESFTYAPICKLLFCMNNLPYSRDKSHGFSRRLLILPFTRQFTEEDADRGLSEKLMQELPGILNFALAGLHRLRQNNYVFTRSHVGEEACGDYRRALNPIQGFVEECIRPGTTNDRISNANIYAAFQVWCRENGHNHSAEMSRQRFMSEVRGILGQLNIPFELKRGSTRDICGILLNKREEDNHSPSGCELIL